MLAPVLMSGADVIRAGFIKKMPALEEPSTVCDIADYNADGFSDVLFKHVSVDRKGRQTIAMKLAYLTSDGKKASPAFTAKVKRIIKLKMDVEGEEIVDSD